MKKFNPSDDQWIRKNFEKLVSGHPGEYVAVAQGKVAFGKTRPEVEQKLSKYTTKIMASVMQVPRKESLTCAL